MIRPFQCHFCVCLDGTFMFSAMKQVKQSKISGWPTIFGRDQKTCLFDHFWPLRAVWEALKTPYRCELKSKLVKLFMGHILKAFRAKKIGPGWQGGSGTVIFGRNMASEASLGPWIMFSLKLAPLAFLCSLGMLETAWGVQRIADAKSFDLRGVEAM